MSRSPEFGGEAGGLASYAAAAGAQSRLPVNRISDLQKFRASILHSVRRGELIMFPKVVDIRVKCNVLQRFSTDLNRIAICLANQKRAGPRATGRPSTPAVGSVTRGSALADC